MQFHHEAINPGSYLLRGFKSSESFGDSDIDLVVVLQDLGGGICEISAAKGWTDNDTNILIGIKAVELGFKHLQFHVRKGKKATRWAKKIGTDELFDYYTVDLEKTLEEIQSGLSST